MTGARTRHIRRKPTFEMLESVGVEPFIPFKVNAQIDPNARFGHYRPGSA